MDRSLGHSHNARSSRGCRTPGVQRNGGLSSRRLIISISTSIISRNPGLSSMMTISLSSETQKLESGLETILSTPISLSPMPTLMTETSGRIYYSTVETTDKPRCRHFKYIRLSFTRNQLIVYPLLLKDFRFRTLNNHK